MKKFFTASFALALALSAGAEELKTLTLGLGQPGIDEPMLVGLGISADGRYVCGPTEVQQGVFLYDLENGSCKFEIVEGGELRNVSNNGIAIGFAGGETASSQIGLTYDWNGEMKIFDLPDESYKYLLGEDLTNDGRIKIGSLVGYGFVTYAAISIDGGEWTLLPMPPAEQLGKYTEGSMAKAISGDGKYIIGHADNFGPIVLWTRNEDGSYDVDPLFTRYCAFDESEVAEKPLAAMFPQAISNNGKYVLCRCAKYITTDEGHQNLLWFPGVYDIEKAQLKQYDEVQEIDYSEAGLNPSSIADDGTFVGMIGSSSVTCSGSFIMKAGETQAQSLSDAFPKYYEVYGEADNLGFSIPTNISADGRYILGYAFYAEDYYDEVSSAYYATFIIDVEGDSAVGAVDSVVASDAIYSLDGVRLSEMKPGLNIVRSADGSVRKVIKK